MPTRPGPLSIGFVPLWLALAIAPPGAAQPAPQERKEFDATETGRVWIEEFLRRFEPHRKLAARSLVRIEIVAATVHRSPAAGIEKVLESPIGVMTGLVIDPLPIIVVPESLAEPKVGPSLHRVAPPPPDDGKVLVGSLGTRYRTRSDSAPATQLTVVERSRPLGLIFLGLADPAFPPPALRVAQRLPAEPREPREGDGFAVPMFRDPIGSDAVVAVPGRFRERTDPRERLGLTGVSSAAAGSPLFSLDGELLGLVGTTPPSERSNATQPRSDGTGAPEEPASQRKVAFGAIMPVLFPVAELRGEFERILANGARPKELGALGISLVDRDGAVFVESTAQVGSAVMIEPPLAPGDRLDALAGKPVPTVLGFERLLEEASGASGDPIALEFERAGEKATATLRFRG